MKSPCRQSLGKAHRLLAPQGHIRIDASGAVGWNPDGDKRGGQKNQDDGHKCERIPRAHPVQETAHERRSRQGHDQPIAMPTTASERPLAKYLEVGLEFGSQLPVPLFAAEES